MTDNINRMYELAKIKLEYRYSIKGEAATVDNCNKEFLIKFFQKPVSNFKVIKANKVMNFTAEKQLELIKWIAKNLTFGFFAHFYDSKFRFTTVRYSGISHADFSQALAGLVCKIWEDLADEQKEEIKRILE